MDIKKQTGFGKATMMTSLIAVAVLWTIFALAGVNEDLYEASGRGDLPEVKRLLAKGADVNAKIEVGGVRGIPKGVKSTALMAASGMGHQEIVQILLEKGADVNARTYAGMTPLMAASGMGHREIVQMLLDKGADVNAMSKTGRTALGETIMSGRPHPEIREMLLKAGADPRTEQAWRKYHLPPPEKLPGVR
jgi:ankyrin repeat protein